MIILTGIYLLGVLIGILDKQEFNTGEMKKDPSWLSIIFWPIYIVVWAFRGEQ